MGKTLSSDTLKQELLTVPYPDLEPHVQRGSVLIVQDGLDLVSVGLAIARDDKALISALILKKALTKATPHDYEMWKNEKRFFNLLIIQPFVVVQNAVALKN